jgi:glyoxylase-like metal-dependent hydrolase (beta-lactamase superfamily II)
MNKTSLALVVTALFWSVPCLGQPAGLPALSGLELAADKTDIERFRIPLNETFSASTFAYTVTVDASYTAYVLVTGRTAPGGRDSLAINGTPVGPGEPHKVALSAGVNTIDIVVASGQGGPSRTYRLTVTRKDMSGEYRTEPLGKGMWRIGDFGGFVANEDMYLIEGSERAILFDTGMGRGDLAGVVRSLTSLPVDVALTHGNRDHFLQVDRFPDRAVYMSAKDITRMPPALVTAKYKWVKDGDVLDLGGGRRFVVAEVPGHSLGSVLYIDMANKVAIIGDAISSGSMVYMFSPTCAALDEYLAGLKKLEVRVSALDGLTLLVGHHYQERTPLEGRAGKQLITDMRTAAEKVLRGELAGTPARTGRDGRVTELAQLTVGLAGLWYNPKNLVTDPAALGFLDVRTPAGNPVIPRPIFSSLQTSYAATVPPDVASIDIVPTAYNPKRRGITINGKTVASGSTFVGALGRGETTFAIAVTPEAGPVRTYTVVVTR